MPEESWVTVLMGAGVAAVTLITATMALMFIPAMVAKPMQKRRLRVQCRGKLVLTFDDGPGPLLTAALLDVLARHAAKASFYLVGFRATRFPEACDALRAAGHDLGCHTDMHRNSWRLWPWRAARDVSDGYRALQRWLPPGADFRPPFGKLTTWSWLAARRRGGRIAWWTHDGGDTHEHLPDPAVVSRRVVQSGGGVVLLHSHDRGPDRQRYVVELTERLLVAAREHGLQVCTMSALMTPAPQTEEPAPRTPPGLSASVRRIDQRGCAIELAPPEEWDGLLESLPDHTVFHRRGWIDSIASAYGLSPVLLKGMRGDRCVSVWPCLELRKGPFWILGSPLPGWSTAYMGPLFAADADPESLLQAYLAHPRMERAAFFGGRVLDEDRDIDLERFGFVRLRREETYLLDLAPNEGCLWQSVEGKCRNMVRKGQKAGLEIRIETGPEFIDEFWAMACEVFGKSRLKPAFTRELTSQLWRRLAPANLVVMSALFEGRRIASLVLPHTRRTMYYWAGASLLAHRDLAANNLLMWEAICHARRLGLSWFDFISTGGGAGRFKKSFGPRAHLVATHWERSRSRLVNVAKRGYESYLRRRRRLQVAH